MLAAAITLVAGPAQAQGPFDLPATSAAEALNAFSRASGLQILFPYEAVAGQRVAAIRGAASAEAALTLLLEATGLRVMVREGDTLVLGPALGAATDPAATLEPVIVTAQRREESLQKTAVSIAALSGAAMDDRGVRDIGDIARLTPNMNFLDSTGISGSRSAFILLRGVGQSEVFLQNDPGVGVYVDGIYLGRTQGSVMEVLDLSRVEVLRGPQGTLYGRNTIGGAINMISAKPTADATLEASVETGSFGTANLRLKANGPLNERLFASLAAAALRHDGYVQASPDPRCPACTGQSLSDEDTLVGRLALRWVPADGLTLDLTADAARRRAHAVGRRLSYVDLNFDTLDYGRAVSTKWGSPLPSFVNPQPHTHASAFAGQDSQDIAGGSMTVTWRTGGVTVKSITGFRTIAVKSSVDGDGAPVAINTVKINALRQDQFSQELQAAGSSTDNRLQWVAGLFAFREDADSRLIQGWRLAESGLTSDRGAILDCFNRSDPRYSCPDQTPFLSALGVRNWAVFGHASWAAAPALTLTLGLRYSWEEKAFSGQGLLGAPLSLKKQWTSTTPKVGAQYQATRDVMAYATYAEGFKSGTFNNGNDPSQPRDVDPEMVRAYEVGVKSQWLGDRLRFNAAAFHSGYDGQQLQVSTGPSTFAFVNVAQSVIRGFEVEVVAKPAPGITLDGGAGLSDSEITSVGVNTPAVRRGARLALAPRWTANIGAAAERRLAGWGLLKIRADYSYKSAQEGDFQNNPLARTAAYGRLGLRMSLGPNNRAWELGLWARNLLDQDYETVRASINPDFFVVSVDGEPRTWGASLTARF